MWRRTLNGWRYSPLDQIDRANLGELRMAWTRALTDGFQSGTPLVYNRVLYMPNPRDVIQAIDAESGDLIGEHRREIPEDSTPGGVSSNNRNIAIYDDLIIDTRAWTPMCLHSRRRPATWCGRHRLLTER